MQTIQIPCTGYSIVADWYASTGSDNVLLALSGFSDNRRSQKHLIAKITEKTGVSVLAIDLSGHGSSPFELKDTRPAQHFLEIINVFDWLQHEQPKAAISVLGYSYGGFLATQLTKYRSFDALVLQAPGLYKPADFYDLWSARLLDEASYRHDIIRYRKDTAALATHPLLARASGFQGKTLVVVHDDDELIPQETTDAYIKAFTADTFIASGFTHGARQSPVSPEQLDSYYDRIADWLR